MGKNRTTNTGGGIGFLVRNDISNITSEDPCMKEDNSAETLWIKIRSKTTINIAVTYGPQENHRKEQTERYYHNLTTDTMRQQKEALAIIMGDLNGKLHINRGECKQEGSRNGAMLQNHMDTTNMTAVNTLNTHTGNWTRVNRKRPDEKSIIDYILISQPLTDNVIESNTDEHGIYRIAGENATDHNTITCTVNTEIKREQQSTRKWKKGDEQGWDKFNSEFQKEWNETKNDPQLQQTIIKSLEKTIGSVKQTTQRKTKITNPEIKEAKKIKKERKKAAKEICTATSTSKTPKKQAMNEYIEAQFTLKQLVDTQIKDNINNTTEKIIREGGANSTTFWNIRKQLLKHNNQEIYPIKDENGKPITTPQEAKDHVANYYENLYQARKGEDSHRRWTEHINKTVNSINYKINNREKECHPFTMEELNETIKTLKQGKSTGPDRIPNVVIIKADKTTRQIYLNELNKIYQEEKIPHQWQEGEIIRIYKGKGDKGKCSNERGITLSSNMGKLFERLINNRIKHKVTFTEAQAGGQHGKATSDHINFLKSIINHSKATKKPIYIAFLDVTKAYDKAWLDAILYVLHKNGLTGKDWRIVKNLNENLTAKIRTQYGKTRKINIRDSIRQGGVLSVIEYANLIDEISKHLTKENQGKLNIWGNTITGCLLWMDDVALIHHDKKELKAMLETTEEIAKRYHIKFGKEKSQILTLNSKYPIDHMEMGDMKHKNI